MDAEVLNLLKLALQTIVQSASTELYGKVASQFKKMITRGKRDEVSARLDAAAERVREAPDRAAAEVESLFAELQPLIDLDRQELKDFVSGATALIREAKPGIVAYSGAVEQQINFVRHVGGPPAPDVSQEVLTEAIALIRDSLAARQELDEKLAETSRELVEASKLARKSQKEAKAAQDGVLMASAVVVKLQRKIDELEHERSVLLDQLADANRQGGDIAELKRKLASAQEDARRSRELQEQSQRDLQVARQQRAEAERLADEAVNELERRQRSWDAERDNRGDLERYEQQLKSLADERQATQKRVREIAESLGSGTASVPLPAPPADPGASAGTGTGTRMGAGTGAARGTSAAASPGKPSASERPASSGGHAPSGTVARESGSGSGKAAGKATSSGAKGPDRTSLGEFVAFAVCGLLGVGVLAGLIWTTWVLGPRDGWIGLDSVTTTGDKPTQDADVTGQLDFALHPGWTSDTTFTAGGDAPRYFNTDLRTSTLNKNCGSAATIDYALYSDDQIISHATVPANGVDRTLNDLPVGTHTHLKLTATVHGPAACRARLQLETPTLDKLTGWERALGGDSQ